MKSFKQYLKEATWTDYYDKIVDLDLDTKTMSSKYKNRKDLESAAAKKYGWNVKSEPFKTAFDKYFNESAKVVKEDKVYVFVAPYGNTMDVVKGEMQSTGGFKHTDSKFNYNRSPNEKPDATKSKLKSMGFKDSDIVIIQESTKALTEAKASHITSIEMESTNSRLDWNFTSQGLTLGSMSGRPVSYYGDNEYRNFYNNSEQQDWTNWLKTSGQGIMKDLEKVADEFDKKIAQVLAKHGFKK